MCRPHSPPDRAGHAQRQIRRDHTGRPDPSQAYARGCAYHLSSIAVLFRSRAPPGVPARDRLLPPGQNTGESSIAIVLDYTGSSKRNRLPIPATAFPVVSAVERCLEHSDYAGRPDPSQARPGYEPDTLLRALLRTWR